MSGGSSRPGDQAFRPVNFVTSDTALPRGASEFIDEERIANALRQQVIGLGMTSGGIAREAVPDRGTGPSGVIRR
jgi:hypothetical protein